MTILHRTVLGFDWFKPPLPSRISHNSPHFPLVSAPSNYRNIRSARHPFLDLTLIPWSRSSFSSGKFWAGESSQPVSIRYEALGPWSQPVWDRGSATVGITTSHPWETDGMVPHLVSTWCLKSEQQRCLRKYLSAGAAVQSFPWQRTQQLCRLLSFIIGERYFCIS